MVDLLTRMLYRRREVMNCFVLFPAISQPLPRATRSSRFSHLQLFPIAPVPASSSFLTFCMLLHLQASISCYSSTSTKRNCLLYLRGVTSQPRHPQVLPSISGRHNHCISHFRNGRQTGFEDSRFCNLKSKATTSLCRDQRREIHCSVVLLIADAGPVHRHL